ncbi:uncharacterized protein [Watersipora subatra]|uniref:uncharacterized protein n=1 Tax=Watersipora subatra TaxID=2589382 RepID=UPI00355B756D
MASAESEPETKHDNSLSMKLTCLGIRKKFSRVPQLSTEELAKWIKEGKPFTLLDVRPEVEHKVSSIAGSIRVDPDNVAEGLAVVEKETSQSLHPVVLYCSVGYRSSMAADSLIQMSQSKGNLQRPIYNLEGSIFKWANENRAIVDSEGSPAQQVHPYNSFFGKILDSSKRFKI